MPVLALVFLLLLPVLAIVLMPFTLVWRYRAGSARRRARGWLASLNLIGLAVSTTLFLIGAALTSYWIAGMFTHALLGVAAGGVLGLLGLLLSRWEREDDALHYTPNRWLVLAVTLVVAGRIAFGVWRAWYGWHSGDGEWTRNALGSLAAGGLVLGYYFVYWLGVRRRLRRAGRTVVEG